MGGVGSDWFGTNIPRHRKWTRVRFCQVAEARLALQQQAWCASRSSEATSKCAVQPTARSCGRNGVLSSALSAIYSLPSLLLSALYYYCKTGPVA